jgi:hypothetical protein
VRAVDQVPQLRVITPGNTEARRQAAGAGSDLVFALTNHTHDIYLCGGKVACECPETALACIRLEDTDECDAKNRLGKVPQKSRVQSKRVLRKSYVNSRVWGVGPSKDCVERNEPFE